MIISLTLDCPHCMQRGVVAYAPLDTTRYTCYYCTNLMTVPTIKVPAVAKTPQGTETFDLFVSPYAPVQAWRVIKVLLSTGALS